MSISRTSVGWFCQIRFMVVLEFALLHYANDLYHSTPMLIQTSW